MINLPEKFCARMRSLLGDGYDDYVSCLELPPKKGLHINLKKCAPEVVDGLGGLSPVLSGGARLVESGRPTQSPYYAVGLFYMQEPSAMSPVSALDLAPNAKVLDLCAAPGGKTSNIAQKTDGLVVANEIEYSRALILKENVTRMGYDNVVVLSMRPDRLAQTFGGYFDAVVVDAPCSGEGMFRKEPLATPNWSEENVRACATRGREIIRSADACLKSGGVMLYSTCTFAPEEDEEAVGFIKSLGYELLPAKGFEKYDCGAGYKLFPHVFEGEGQFFALLRKTGEGAPTKKIGKPLCAPTKAELALANEVVDLTGLSVAKNGELLFVPALPFDLPCLQNGVPLGKIEKNRFTPVHGLWTALASRARSTENLPLGDERVTAYLRGEEIAGEAKGWCAVCVDGYALGGGKGSQGVIKNHYPKGLRN